MLELQTLLLIPEHICMLLFFSDHFLLVSTQKLKALLPDFDVCVSFAKFGSSHLSDVPMFNLKFSTHPAWVSDCCCGK